MAITPMLSNNALTVKIWERLGFLDIYKKTAFGHAFRRGSIVRTEDLDRAKAGDQTTISFNAILTGVGVGEGGTLVNNEESLNLSSFTMTYGELRHAVASPNTSTIEQQRTYVNFEENATQLLPGWHGARIDASYFNQLAGVNSTTITLPDGGVVYSGSDRLFIQGFNTPTAPTSNRIVRAGGAASDEALTSTDTMTLDLLDAALELASVNYPTLEPLDNDEFDLFLHPYQITDLKRDAGSKISWYDINLAAMMGGRIDDNYINQNSYFGMSEVGRYGKVKIYSNTRIASGQNSSTAAAISTVKRAVLCGKKAAFFGSPFSGGLADFTGENNGSGELPLKYFTEVSDFAYIKAIEARIIYGLKKAVFNGEDYGSLVIGTYAASHTS